MENKEQTLVEKSGFLPSTGLRGYNAGVPTRYEEESSLIEGAKREMERMKVGSYTPPVSAINPDDDSEKGSDISGIDTSFDVDTSFSGLKSALNGGDDPRKKKEESYNKLNSMIKSIQDKSRNTYSGKQTSYGEVIAGNQQSSAADFGVFGKGRTIKLDEAYDFLSDGNIGLAKFKSYMPGRDNEDYYGRRQTTWNKAVNGIGKLVTKTALYGVSGVVGIIPAAYNLIKTGTLSSAFDNDFTRTINDIDERINHSLPHYYTREERDMGFLQSLGTANFIFNDVIGNGLSFTTGAILSAYLTGGMGVSSLGAVGAKVGMKVAGKMAASKIAASAVKSAFGAYRAGAMYGRAIGNMAKVGVNTFVGAGWESAVEAQSFMKDSESKYKEYFKNMYGRNPNQSEMAEFKSSISDTANSIFLANMGIVGLSNYLLLGKYLGVDTGFASKYIPGLKGVSDTYGGSKSFIDRYLFGLGTKKVAGDAGRLQTLKANLFQKSLATVWNVSKRPISEGVWEEGMQGVAQRMGEDFIRSRYDKTYLDATSSIVDSFSKAIAEQFTTKEGLKEIGIGSLIGGLFGARNGAFGLYERRNKERTINTDVEKFNSNNAFTSQSVKDSMRNLAEFNAQMNDPESDYYSKFELSDRMGMLEDTANNFRSMVKSLDESELASEMKVDEETVKKYKEDIIKDFDKKLANYKKASSFAEAITAETSSDLYRSNVANAVFKGLDAEDIAMEASNDIADYVNDNNLFDDINTFYSLSSQAFDTANQLRELRNEINDLNAEIERLATTPRRVEDGNDTEAEAIKQKTIKYDNLNKEYRRLSEELLSSYKEVFYSFDPGVLALELFKSETITAEDILKAYDSVASLSTYIENNKGKKEAEDLRNMVVKYQQAITQYKVLRSFMNSIQDKKFMRHDFSLFSKFLNDMVSSNTESIESDRFYQTEGNNVSLDEKIDELLNNGEINLDEAFTMKVFGHLNDGITQKPKEDILSDFDYELAMKDLLSAPIEVRERIVDKIYTGNQDLLSPREKEIYEKYKQDIDDYISYLGDSPAKMIKDLSDKVKRLTEPRSVYEDNKIIIDMAKSNLEPDQRQELDDAISSYVDIMNRRDKGEKVDEDKLADSVFTIEDLGQVGNITDLLPYVEQNRIIDKGRISESTLSNFGEDDANIDSLVNELDESDNTPGANIDSAQNPETLMVRRISNDGNERYEIAGLRADKFISSIKSLVPIQISSETNANGTKRYFLNIGGETATVIELPYHARWSIDKESARVLNRYTDVSIQDVGNSYSLVYKRLDSDELVPYRTGVGFGENEVDKIDQEALSSLKKGDKVNLEIDVNDTYNQSLFAEYNDAVQSGDKKRIESAENKLVSNMVIKVMSGSRFVSVVKADTGGIDGISKIRRTAFNKWKKDAGRSATIGVGTHVVAQTLPGRPVFNMKVNGQGYGQVENLPITEKGAEKVSDVGYVLNGKVVLKNGSKYTGFPFAYSILNDKGNNYKNVRVPVVVIKGKNGLNYLFPVSLRSVESEEGRKWMSFIDMLLESGDSELLQMDQDDIQDLNAYLTKLGLDPASYQVSYLNPISGLRKAREAIEKLSTVPDVVKWVEDESRNVKDIVTSEVESGIDFEGEMFVAPKIRIQFGKSSSRPKSLIEDDLPFSDEGKTVTSKEYVDVYEEEMPEEGAARETQTAPLAQPAPAAQDAQSLPGKKRTSRKNFSLMLNEIESHIEKEGLPPYANIFDFIARKIVGGDLRFLRERGNPKSLKEEMGLEPKGTVGDKISTPSSKGGKTLEEYISWLRSQTDQVVVDYVGPRSDEQIISELKNFLKYINFVPSKALNYSLRVNGMDTLKEYGTKEEVEKMESDINSLVSKVLPTVDNKTVEDVSTAIKSNNLPAIWRPVESLDMTNEEKIEFLNNVADFLSGIPEYDAVVESIESESDNILNDGKEGSAEGGAVRTEEDGDKKGDGEGKGQSRTNVEVEGNVELPGSTKGEMTYFADPLTAQDIKDVRDFLLSTHYFFNASSLSNAILFDFYVDGSLILNEQKLRRSGLYDETEISRILSDPSVLNEVLTSMRKLIDSSINEHDREKDNYFMSIDYQYGPIVYKEGVFNQFGKKVPYNPSELYYAMRKTVAGIKNFSEFSSAFESLRNSYPELVEKFVSDKEFAESMFDEFSSTNKIPVINIEGDDVVEGKRRSLSKLQDLSYYNPGKIEFLRARISAYLHRANADTESDLRSMIWDIEEACTWFGIDIIGTSETYDGTEESLNKIDNLMLDLDIYVARHNDVNYAPTLASSIDDVLGDSTDYYSELLPEYMDNLNIVYSESNIDPVEAFEKHSLLKVGDNLYQRISKDDINEMYQISTVLAKHNLTHFSTKIYPESCFKNGVLDKEKVRNVDNNTLMASIKKYVRSFMDSQNTEDMIMTRMAFGHPAVLDVPYVDVDREYSRYMNKKQDSENPLSLFDLYQSYLDNKLHKTKLYDNAYKYLDFKPGPSLGLISDDPDILKSIELSLSGKDRLMLFDYSMTSTDPSLSELFYLEKYDSSYAGNDFEHYFYTRHPYLLKEKSGPNIVEQDGVITAEGIYDNFIRVGNKIWSKVSESSSGSIYQNLTGTESEVKYDSTQKAKTVETDYAPYQNRSGLTQDMIVSKSELDDLNKLECK